MNNLLKDISDAELVLVGIGDEFAYDWSNLTIESRFQQCEAEIEKNEKYRWIIPVLQKLDLNHYEDKRLQSAYIKLKKLISDKNYFIISLLTDDYIYRYFDENDSVVTPCGGFRNFQCDKNCSQSVLPIEQDIIDNVNAYYNNEMELNALHEKKCSKCGASLRFNQIGVSKYAEEGYLSKWSTYTKWLQGTVNRRLCVIELGVGMEFPSIIRFPFEKMVYYNQKACLYRIHSALFQPGEMISERTTSIAQNPIDYLNEFNI